MLERIVEKSLEATNAQPDDYRKNGLLYCHVCHHPKERRLELLGKEQIVGVLCECERAKREEEEEASKKHQAEMAFWEKMTDLRKDNICDPTYETVTLANDDGTNQKVSNFCRKYIDRWPQMLENNIGVLFHGPVGTGKSFFACAIANELLQKHVPTTITSFPRLLNLLQDSSNRQWLLDGLRNYKLVVIDDLGVERETSYAAEQIFAVIDARSRAKLPTIITTNLTKQEMENQPSMHYRRIFDRVREMCPAVVLIDGQSRRIQNAHQRRELARELLI